jgi:hypothetical protein
MIFAKDMNTPAGNARNDIVRRRADSRGKRCREEKKQQSRFDRVLPVINHPSPTNVPTGNAENDTVRNKEIVNSL